MLLRGRAAVAALKLEYCQPCVVASNHSVQLSAEQRTQLREKVVEGRSPRVAHVNFDLSVGAVVPRGSVEIVPVPETLVEIQPAWRRSPNRGQDLRGQPSGWERQERGSGAERISRAAMGRDGRNPHLLGRSRWASSSPRESPRQAPGKLQDLSGRRPGTVSISSTPAGISLRIFSSAGWVPVAWSFLTNRRRRGIRAGGPARSLDPAKGSRRADCPPRGVGLCAERVAVTQGATLPNSRSKPATEDASSEVI